MNDNANKFDLIDINELSDLLGVPLSTLRFWRHKGRGPKSANIGRIVYRRADVEAWLDEQFEGGDK